MSGVIRQVQVDTSGLVENMELMRRPFVTHHYLNLLPNSTYLFSTNPKSGWLSLQPYDKNEAVGSLCFSLYHNQSYTIGCGHGKDLTLISVTNPTDSYPEALMIVENAAIKLENVSATETVTVDTQVLKLNEKVALKPPQHMSLASAMIRFGSYRYQLRTATAPSSEFMSKFCDFTKCASCRRFWREPRPLPCGHVLCSICVNTLCNQALDQSDRLMQHRLMHSPNAILVEPPQMSCPTCRCKIPISDLADTPSQPILASVGNSISSLLSIRPMCSNCHNCRCLTSFSEYMRCLTCNNARLCILCALDLHRKHTLRSEYEIQLESGVKYANMAVTVKTQFANSRKLHSEAVKTVKTLNEYLAECQRKLNASERLIDDILKPVKVTVAKLKTLERYRFDEKAVEQREETLTLFQRYVESAKAPLRPLLENLKVKSNTIFKVQLEQEAKSVSIEMNE